ncbi:MAG TPA: hypothetical protein VM529_25930 [Gemmata sp.]|nr:hypothetical protein [Gemmata sp.]
MIAMWGCFALSAVNIALAFWTISDGSPGVAGFHWFTAGWCAAFGVACGVGEKQRRIAHDRA